MVSLLTTMKDKLAPWTDSLGTAASQLYGKKINSVLLDLVCNGSQPEHLCSTRTPTHVSGHGLPPKNISHSQHGAEKIETQWMC